MLRELNGYPNLSLRWMLTVSPSCLLRSASRRPAESGQRPEQTSPPPTQEETKWFLFEIGWPGEIGWPDASGGWAS